MGAAVIALLLGVATSRAQNSTNLSIAPAPTVGAVAAGGLGTGGFVQGGESIFINPNPGGYGEFASGTFSQQVSAGGPVSAADSFSSTYTTSSFQLPYSASSSASAGFGTMHLSASSAGSTFVPFPQGAAQGGWTDNLTIEGSLPNGNPIPQGTPGNMIFQVSVDGTLSSTVDGSARFWLTPYVNNNRVNQDTVFQQANPAPSYGYQTAVWTATANGSPASLTLNNEIVTFDVPFEFGDSFSLGLYADALASDAYSGGGSFTTTQSTASSDFANTVTWDGISGISEGGTPVSSFSVGSLSGTDWITPSSVPDGLSTGLMLAGVTLLMVFRRSLQAGFQFAR